MLGYQSYPSALELLGLELDSNPKEATCKGGLIGSALNSAPDRIVLKTSEGQLVETDDTYASIGTEQRQAIVDSVKEFFRFVLEVMPAEFDFNGNFGVDKMALNKAKEVCGQDLDTYLEKGIAVSVKESGDDANQIEDALLFYPIKGAIQELSERLKEYYDKK